MKAGWGRSFEEPIRIDGRSLGTLREAGEYIAGLPKKEHDAPEWRAAMEALLLVVERGGPTMFARIGVMRALNRHYVPEFDPKGKEPHWGRRKLKRDNDGTSPVGSVDVAQWSHPVRVEPSGHGRS